MQNAVGIAPEQKVELNAQAFWKKEYSTLLDIEGAARFLGLTHWQVRGLLADGELRCLRVGRKLYLRRATLIRWAENSEGKYKVAV